MPLFLRSTSIFSLFLTLFALGVGSPSAVLAAPAAAPKVIAHRGGTEDAPENTLYAICSALEHGADMIWLSVQMTSDGIPVLYRPMSLSELTDGQGPISRITLARLRTLNAGYQFQRTCPDGSVIYPFRNQPLRVPTLREALQTIPPQIPIFLDMKSMPALPLVRTVAQILEETHSWNRVRMYSTESAHNQAWKAYPKAQLFEDRDITRQRLVDLMLGNPCIPPPRGTWLGMELIRPVDVVEYFTLGKGISKSVAHWWNAKAVAFHRRLGEVHIILFGINDKASYEKAKELGVDAVMTNSPARLRRWAAECQSKKLASSTH